MGGWGEVVERKEKERKGQYRKGKEGNVNERKGWENGRIGKEHNYKERKGEKKGRGTGRARSTSTWWAGYGHVAPAGDGLVCVCAIPCRSKQGAGDEICPRGKGGEGEGEERGRADCMMVRKGWRAMALALDQHTCGRERSGSTARENAWYNKWRSGKGKGRKEGKQEKQQHRGYVPGGRADGEKDIYEKERIRQGREGRGMQGKDLTAITGIDTADSNCVKGSYVSLSALCQHLQERHE